MTLFEAVELMKTARDIIDWNLKRQKIIKTVGTEKYNKEFAYHIDASGLIKKVLTKNHKPFKYK